MRESQLLGAGLLGHPHAVDRSAMSEAGRPGTVGFFGTLTVHDQEVGVRKVHVEVGRHPIQVLVVGKERERAVSRPLLEAVGDGFLRMVGDVHRDDQALLHRIFPFADRDVLLLLEQPFVLVHLDDSEPTLPMDESHRGFRELDVLGDDAALHHPVVDRKERGNHECVEHLLGADAVLDRAVEPEHHVLPVKERRQEQPQGVVVVPVGEQDDHLADAPFLEDVSTARDYPASRIHDHSRSLRNAVRDDPETGRVAPVAGALGVGDGHGPSAAVDYDLHGLLLLSVLRAKQLVQLMISLIFIAKRSQSVNACFLLPRGLGRGKKFYVTNCSSYRLSLTHSAKLAIKRQEGAEVKRALPSHKKEQAGKKMPGRLY